jgi:hypothetical protein
MPLGIIRFLFVFRESVKLLKLFENVQCRWGDSKIYCIYCTIRTNRVPAQQKSLTMVVRIQWRKSRWGGGWGGRPSTYDPRPSTYDPRPMTLDTRPLPKLVTSSFFENVTVTVTVTVTSSKK